MVCSALRSEGGKYSLGEGEVWESRGVWDASSWSPSGRVFSRHQGPLSPGVSQTVLSGPLASAV